MIVLILKLLNASIITILIKNSVYTRFCTFGANSIQLMSDYASI